MLLRLYARRIVGRRSSWATSANSSLATDCSVTCNRSPAFSGSVLTERKHASNLFATRWQRCAGVILLRSGVGGLPFGFSAPMCCRFSLRTTDTWFDPVLLAGSRSCISPALSPFGATFFVGRGRTVCAQSVDFCSGRIPAGSPALLKFEWGWGAGWFLACVWFYGSGFGGLRLPCRAAGQRNGALEINSFGTA